MKLRAGFRFAALVLGAGFASATVALSLAQEATSNESRRFESIQRETGLPIESLEYLATAPPEDAWTAYKTMGGGDRKAGLKLAQNRGMESYLDALTRDIPREALRDNDRAEFLRLLGTVPAGWSVRVLCKYLFDHRLTYRGNEQANCYTLTADALAQMELPGAPGQRRGARGEPVGEDVFAWRKWWYANRERIDELVQEVNYDYPSAKPAASLPPKITLRYRAAPRRSLLENPVLEMSISDPRLDFGKLPLNAKASQTIESRLKTAPQNIFITVEREEKEGFRAHPFAVVSQVVSTGKAQAYVSLQLLMPFPSVVRDRRMREAADAPARKDVYLKDRDTRFANLEGLVENEPGAYRITVSFDSPQGTLSAQPCLFTVKDTGNSYRQYLDEIIPID